MNHTYIELDLTIVYEYTTYQIPFDFNIYEDITA